MKIQLRNGIIEKEYVYHEIKFRENLNILRKYEIKKCKILFNEPLFYHKMFK